MNGQRSPGILTAVLALLILGLSLADAWLRADDARVHPETKGIRFLRLKANSLGFTLLQAEVRPGVLKQPRDGQSRGGILCELLDDAGQVLWHGRTPDPLTRRFETVDPNQPGRFIVKELRLPEAEFTIRVPHHARAAAVQLRFSPEAPTAGQVQGGRRGPIRLPLPKVPGKEAISP